MFIHFYHHRKIVARALAKLLENEGYQVFYNQEYGILQSHIPFKNDTLLLIDLDSLSYLDPIQTSILCNLKQHIVLLGSLQQLNWYFKLSSKSKGFICKTDKGPLFQPYTKKLQKRDSFLCPETAKFLRKDRFIQQKNLLEETLNQPLTKTELKVMLEIGIGKSSKQIAEDSHRSPYTINNHRKSIIKKLRFNKALRLSKSCFKKIDAIETLVVLEENKKFIKALLKNN